MGKCKGADCTDTGGYIKGGLLDERDKIPEIAENGRQWALAHYCTAKRFSGYVTYQ